MKKILLVLLALVMTLGLMTGCGSDKKAAPQKSLKIGTEPTFAPFEFQKDGSKDFDGFDMDLIRAIGKKMNMKVEIQNMGFDALIPALNSGNIDAAIAGMSITPDRQKTVDFTKAYYKSGLVVVVNKDDNSIKSDKDLKGKKIAVQIGTTGAEKAGKVQAAKVTSFNTNAEVFLELKNHGADAVIIDAPVAAYYLVQSGKDSAKIVGSVMEAESYGIALKKNSKLTAEMDKALEELKKDGEYDKLYQKWFGNAAKAK